MKYLMRIGIAMLVVGGIGALLAKKAAEDKAFSDELTGALMGYRWNVEPDYTGMWVFIVVAALGVVAIFLHLQRRETQVSPASSSEGEKTGLEG